MNTKKSDIVLYSIKETGKNKVIHYTKELENKVNK